MDNLKNIFYQLNQNQTKICRKKSFINSSLINLEDYTNYNFSDSYDYKYNIWFILYYLNNEINDKTYIEQNKLFKEYMMSMIDRIGQDKKNKSFYNKKEVSNSIQNILNTGISTKIYLSMIYSVNIIILYLKNDICIQYGNHEDSIFLVYDNDRMNLYYNKDNYMSDVDKDKIINYETLKNYKKLKIAELRDLSEKLKIDLKINDKNKTKALLIQDIDRFLDNLL